MAEIEVQELNKSFGKRKVLNNISFRLEKGGFLSIFGPNGAGKTTLLKILSALVDPTSGRVLISGQSPSDDSIGARRKIGLISHNPLLYRDLTALENLSFYGSIYGIPDPKERIDLLLERVELSHRRYDLVRTFSRGMLQRLAIARALLHQPSILLLDEPHSGLDPHAVDILDGLLEQIRPDHTFIMVTHSLEKGLALCSSAMILDSGRIIFQQGKESMDVETLRRIYHERVKGQG
jgi:heme exporter protein A